MDQGSGDSRTGIPGKKRILESAASVAKRAWLDKGSAPEASPDHIIVLQGLSLLWHDHWTAAHEIAQAREGERDFDLLHAMLHRREGDFANSGYWFRQAGKHPCYPTLEGELRALLDARTLETLMPGGEWSPTAFVTEVSKAFRGPDRGAAVSEALITVQAEEFRAFASWLLMG